MSSMAHATEKFDEKSPPQDQVDKKPEKTTFNLILEKFDPTSKAKIIREIKLMMPHLNLVEVYLYF